MNYRSLAGENIVDALRLIRTPGVGPITFFKLLENYGSCAAALAALPELSRRGGRKTPLNAIKREEAEKEIDAAQKFGARMIMYGAGNYPGLLLNIPDP